MSWYDALIWLATLIGAISAIVVAVRKAIKPFTSAKDDITAISKKVDKLIEHDNEQYLSILRITLMSPEIPISERIIAGDKYIKSMADLLKACADDTDIVCRYGGDEYIFISVQHSWDDCVKKLNSITSNIKEPLSASAGCVFDVVTGMDELNLLIEEADKRMYETKRRKKRER